MNYAASGIRPTTTARSPSERNCEGLRCKKRLWREPGRAQLESFRLAPGARRRREDLLQLLDRLNPMLADLTQGIEQEVEKCPEAQRLRTHPGVGPLTALAFVLIIGRAERFQCGKQIAAYLRWCPWRTPAEIGALVLLVHLSCSPGCSAVAAVLSMRVMAVFHQPCRAPTMGPLSTNDSS